MGVLLPLGFLQLLQDTDAVRLAVPSADFEIPYVSRLVEHPADGADDAAGRWGQDGMAQADSRPASEAWIPVSYRGTVPERGGPATRPAAD